MFLEPGFWVMIAGTVLVTVSFLGLAFSRMGDVPGSDDKEKEEQPEKNVRSRAREATRD